MIGTLIDAKGAELRDADEICAVFLSAIQEVIGPAGTVFAPTYSYTIGRASADNPVVFDKVMTPSEVGPFGSYLRSRPGALRNNDSMVSVAGLGPFAGQVLQDASPTSYGDDCVFERLLDLPNTKVTNIGLGPNWMPFIHYADYLSNVPYRYDKLFLGWTEHEGETRQSTWVYQVPARIPEARANAHQTGAVAVERGVFQSAKIGRARVFSAGYREYFDTCMELLAKNAWANTSGPDCDVMAREYQIAPDLPSDIPQPGAALSLAQSQRLQAIREAMPNLSHATARTGDNLFDWIVPERYVVRSARVEREDGQVLDNLRLLPYSVSAELDQYGAELLARSERWNSREGPEWIWKDWGFDEHPDVDPNARYHVSIETTSSMGELKALFHSTGNRPAPLVIVDTATGPELASADLAAFCRRVANECPNDHFAAAPGDVGAALALSALAPRNVTKIKRVQFTKNDAVTTPRPVRASLPSGWNPVARFPVPNIPVSVMNIAEQDLLAPLSPLHD